ncbi:MAG: hypothetical protein ACE5JQ_16125 [Candidatus Methylomirabilales bacterium]
MIRSRSGLSTVLTGVVCIIVLMTGCATGRARGALYRDEGKGFQVQLPGNGWQVTESPGTDLALRDTRSAASMAVAVSCPEKETGPLPSLVRHLYFGLRQVKRLRQERIELDGALGLDTVITGSWDGTSVQIRSVVMRREGCLYDLLYVSPSNAFGSRSADFDGFVDSWQFLSEQP